MRLVQAQSWRVVKGGRREALRASAIVARVPAEVGGQSPRKNSNSHIDASHSRQPLVKGERLVRLEVNAVIPMKCLLELET